MLSASDAQILRGNFLVQKINPLEREISCGKVDNEYTSDIRTDSSVSDQGRSEIHQGTH